MSTAELIERIRLLPPAEKCELLERMWEEFGDELSETDDQFSPEQVAELERRLQGFENNPDSGVPFEEVEAKIKRRFGW